MTGSERLGPLRLMVLLVRFRWRHARHSFWRGGGSGSRWISLAALGLPLAYVGLFVSAFQVIASLAAWPVQSATMVVVAAGLTLASLAGKITGGDAIVAGTGENEFYLSRPISLGRLVAARALAAAVLDVWGGLFLLPVLAAAAVVWKLGWLGLVFAATLSWLLQVVLVAVGQAVALGLLGKIPLARKRLLQTGLGLLAAVSVALLWVVASFVLRQPARFVEAIGPYADAINSSPLSLLVRPLLALRERPRTDALVGLLMFALAAAFAVALAAYVAERAGRRGWEDAGLPFAPPARLSRPHTNRKPLSMAGKELRLLLRDRARFVTLLAMPLLFVGVQIFGAVGFDAFGGSASAAGLLAYSLAAYLATLGPFPHMQGERRAFWILRSVPVPLGRLMWGKVKAWLVLIVAMGSLAFWGTVLLAIPQAYALWSTWHTFGLVVFGSSLVCVLAVGVGCNVADLSHEGRSAVSPGSIYVFLLVAGLFNVALVREGEIVWRTLALYVAAVSLVWMTGIERARDALDPERTRDLTPGDGAMAAVLFYAGIHLPAANSIGLPPGQVETVQAVWAGLVLAGAVLFVFGVRREGRRRSGGTFALLPKQGGSLARKLAILVTAMALVLGLRHLSGETLRVPLVFVAAEEMVFRGMLQASLLQRARSRALRPNRASLIVVSLIGLAVACVASRGPLSGSALAVQVIAVAAFSCGGYVWTGAAARVLVWLL